MPTTLQLNCLIEGEDKVFTVTAAGDDNVSILKELIQSKRALCTLRGVDPHDLELWKVSVIDDLLHEMTFHFSGQGLQLYRRRARRHSR